MAANSAVQGLIWPNFEPIQDFIVVLVTCKNKEDPIKNEGTSLRVVTTLFIDFSDAQGQLTPKSVLPKFNCSKLSQAFMDVLVTYKNEEDSSKNEGTRAVSIFFGDFSRRLRAANSAVPGRIFPNFESIRDFIGVLVTCKNKEEPIKNEGARVFTRFSPL